MPTTPGEAFDEYMEAFAAGDSDRIWELSAPAARRDSARFRDELKGVLMDPDPVRRLRVEGTYGDGVTVILSMNEEQFHDWWVSTLRKRLGGAQVRKIVESWRRVLVKQTGLDTAVVGYRELQGRINELPVIRIDEIWYVNRSIFPEDALPPEPAPEDQPLREDEEPWDPADEPPEPE